MKPMECGCDNDSEEFNPPNALFTITTLKAENKKHRNLLKSTAYSLAVNVGARAFPGLLDKWLAEALVTLLNK